MSHQQERSSPHLRGDSSSVIGAVCTTCVEKFGAHFVASAGYSVNSILRDANGSCYSRAGIRNSSFWMRPLHWRPATDPAPNVCIRAIRTFLQHGRRATLGRAANRCAPRSWMPSCSASGSTRKGNSVPGAAHCIHCPPASLCAAMQLPFANYGMESAYCAGRHTDTPTLGGRQCRTVCRTVCRKTWMYSPRAPACPRSRPATTLCYMQQRAVLQFVHKYDFAHEHELVHKHELHTEELTWQL